MEKKFPVGERILTGKERPEGKPGETGAVVKGSRKISVGFSIRKVAGTQGEVRRGIEKLPETGELPAKGGLLHEGYSHLWTQEPDPVEKEWGELRGKKGGERRKIDH